MNVHLHTMQASAVVPSCLKDAPSFIEAQFPVGRISTESYKERKAGGGQTLTALGSYWKGRKPLVLVRATLLGCLLPATDQPLADLKVFLLLMGMDDASFSRRIKSIKPTNIDKSFERYDELVSEQPSGPGRPQWQKNLAKADRDTLIAQWLSTLPYDQRLNYCFRPEEVQDGLIHTESWDYINAHLGTLAYSIAEIVQQLGIMRFGHTPRVADTFAGGGSIPFEAARMGCDTYASDLNPIACMLNWGAFNVIGANSADRAKIEAVQHGIAEAVESEYIAGGFETDSAGNRAKSFLYCLEATCPKTGWEVPLLSSLVISKTRSVVARLRPVHAERRYDIIVESGVSATEMAAAEAGTVVKGRLVHPQNPEKDGVSIGVIRGDYKAAGVTGNMLRKWDKEDFVPREGDVFRERLYCIQWTSSGATGARQETFFATVREEDLERERRVEAHVRANLSAWQRDGLAPDMPILSGDKTDEPIRTRGWTYWHHLFSARQLLLLATILKRSRQSPASLLQFAKAADRSSKLCRWNPGHPGRPGTAPTAEKAGETFDNQALNVQINYAVRSAKEVLSYLDRYELAHSPIANVNEVRSCAASHITERNDIYITDPPYADAVNYHELTEFFIAWLRKNPPEAFRGWTWDSQRESAIRGSDERFRSGMVAAYRAMAEHMPDNGMQVVMFTHQDAGVWADLAAIMWAAGLRVSAAWNIVTETESALKEGNYVQGTILLVLRKRLHAGNIKRMDIEGEIEEAVDHQLAALHDLDEDWTSERLYTDGDLQLAAYAAALRVITGYATIDRKEVGADVYRKLAKGEKTVIRELIEYAASVANNKLVPDGFAPVMWRDLDAPSRFYVRMLDMESKGTTKFADYQDFARTFSVADYADLMDSTKANAAFLAGAGALKGKILGTKGFGSSPLRRVLFAIYKTLQKDDPREGLAFLKTELVQDYWVNRAKLVALAKYVSAKTARTRPVESSAADLLAQRLEVDKV